MKALGEALESFLDYRALDPVIPSEVSVRLSVGEMEGMGARTEGPRQHMTPKRRGKSL